MPATTSTGLKLLVSLCGMLPIAGAAAENPFAPGSGRTTLSLAMLDAIRGGFDLPDLQLKLSFGIDQAVFVNGELIATNVLNVEQVRDSIGAKVDQAVTKLDAEALRSRIQDAVAQQLSNAGLKTSIVPTGKSGPAVEEEDAGGSASVVGTVPAPVQQVAPAPPSGGTPPPLALAPAVDPVGAGSPPQAVAPGPAQVTSPELAPTPTPKAPAPVTASPTPVALAPQAPAVVAPPAATVIAPPAPSVVAPQAPAVVAPPAPVAEAPKAPVADAPPAPVVVAPQVTAPVAAAPTNSPPLAAAPKPDPVAVATRAPEPTVVAPAPPVAAPAPVPTPSGTGILPITVVQNGGGGAVGTTLSVPGGGSAVTTVIQNSLDNQQIQALTVVNASVNSMQLLQAMNLGTSIRESLISSLRR